MCRSLSEQGLWFSGSCQGFAGKITFSFRARRISLFHAREFLSLVLCVIISFLLWEILSPWYGCASWIVCLCFFPSEPSLSPAFLCHFVVSSLAGWHWWVFLEWSHHGKELECSSSFHCTCQASKLHASWLVFIMQVLNLA